MFESAEPFSRPFNTDLPQRAPSAARLAAEAFFAPAPALLPETSAPAVVVKKSKLEDPLPALSGDTPEADEPLRGPRVFRLPALAEVADVGGQFTSATNEPGVVAQESQPGGAVCPPPSAVSRRRKRPVLHGEVTITRPAAPVYAVAAAAGVTTTNASGNRPASDSTPVCTSQYAVRGLATGRAAAAAEWPRYLAMRRQLLALQAEA